MSIEHKAFIFDYEMFELELKDILELAIDSNDSTGLKQFIDLNINDITDPYEGERLSENWYEMLESENAQHYGDFALTKFYNPTEDIGLGYEWIKIEDMLSNNIGESISILGKPIGKIDNYFDPGKMGSYFQSLSMLVNSRNEIILLKKNNKKLFEILVPVIQMFDSAIRSEKGLYVSF